MKNLRVGALVGALIATSFLLSAYTFEAIIHVGVPRIVTSSLFLTAQTLWMGFLASHCCVVLERHFDQRAASTLDAIAGRAGDIVEAIHNAVEEAGDRRATQAHLDVLERLSRQPIRRGGSLASVD